MRPTPYVQLPYLTLQLLLCLDPSPPWDLFSALAHALICYLTISSSILELDAGVGYMNYILGSAVGTGAVHGFYLLFLAKPLKNFKYIGNGDGSVHKVWWEKYFDVACVPYSPRLIGWSHQVRIFHPCCATEPERVRYLGEEHSSRPTTTQTFVHPPLHPTCCPVRDPL